MFDGLRSVFRGKGNRDRAGRGDLEVCCAVLIAKCVTSHNDWLGPSRNKARNVRDDDGFAENDATEDVANRAVGRTPHLLQTEFFDTRLVRSDGGAFDADTVFLDSVRCIDRPLVVGGIAVLDRQVVVAQVDVQVRVDEAIFDELPDDPCHFIAVKFDDWSLYLNG